MFINPHAVSRKHQIMVRFPDISRIVGPQYGPKFMSSIRPLDFEGRS